MYITVDTQHPKPISNSYIMLQVKFDFTMYVNFDLT